MSKVVAIKVAGRKNDIGLRVADFLVVLNLNEHELNAINDIDFSGYVGNFDKISNICRIKRTYRTLFSITSQINIIKNYKPSLSDLYSILVIICHMMNHVNKTYR